MRYVGGKVRQSRKIKDAILSLRGARNRYVEPFVGGGSVFAEVAPAFEQAVAGDVVLDLILLWRAVRDGWIPPAQISREEWARLRDDDPSALRAWAGFAASYNGKWFAGYGPAAAGRDYLAEAQRAILRKAQGFAGREIVCRSYEGHTIDASTVVYCDIPYEGTETYKGAPSFDHARFWRWAETCADRGALVLVHEYTSPDGWSPALVTERVETMNHGGPSSGKRAEILWQKT